MTSDNPYDSPRGAALNGVANPGPLMWSVATVFGCSILGGLLGWGIGTALGTFVPNYYRSVFRAGADPNFDAVAVGMGQGVTQGLVFGGIVGLLLVGMWYWYRARQAHDRHIGPM